MGNAFPAIAGTLILRNRTHILNMAGWIYFRFIETHEVHSGFEFPFTMFGFYPFDTGSNYHNYHHLKNIGNYGSFTRIWDSLFGTNSTYILKGEGMKKLTNEKLKKN
jgi:sterol desaturase/sphingolipid hydroxylase (fatty acid hydroxylase superfamily)